MRDRPQDKGLKPLGLPDTEAVPTPPGRQSVPGRLVGSAMASRSREFWILAGSFFVCGASTNGLVGTHLIPACMDHGIPEVQAAGLLALMGLFDLFGTTGSGWLSDRFDNRLLLFTYYGFRGLSLLYLPYGFVSEGHGSRWLFRCVLWPRLDCHRASDRSADPAGFGAGESQAWFSAGSWPPTRSAPPWRPRSRASFAPRGQLRPCLHIRGSSLHDLGHRRPVCCQAPGQACFEPPPRLAAPV